MSPAPAHADSQKAEPVETTVASNPGYPFVIVDDSSLLSKDPVSWSGHPFRCPNCGTPFLQFMTSCWKSECRTVFKVESRVVDDYKKKHGIE